MLAAITVLVATSGGWTPATAQTAPVIASAAPLPGTVGTAYLHQFTAGPLDLVFAVTGGTLPPGLLLTPHGFLAGAPSRSAVAAGSRTPACGRWCSAWR